MEITAQTPEEFEKQFYQFLSQPKCKDIRNIIYSWEVENPIPRVNGESKVIYIGQSKRSFNERYSGSKDFKIEADYFNRFYRHAISKYGPISISIESSENPKMAEWEQLMNYREKHLEYPPLNRSIPNKPKENNA